MTSSYYQLWPASQAEILCSSQKDDQYFNLWIDADLQEVLQQVLGPRTWINFRNVICSMSRFTYLSFTTLSNRKTLGEEYTNINLVTDVISGQTPSLLNRILMVSMQSFDSQILKYLTKQFITFAQRNKDSQLIRNIVQSMGDKLNSKSIECKLALIYKAHLIAFFLYGNYYKLSNRLMNSNYGVNDSTLHFAERFKTVYKIIGCLYIVELLASIMKLKKSESLDRDHSVGKNDPDKTISISDSKTRCSLCMETRRHSTSTLCGHLFCWECIHQWLKYKQECAVCRNQVEPSRLIKLNNYYP